MMMFIFKKLISRFFFPLSLVIELLLLGILLKKRRTNRNDRWFFVFGFEKKERVDISENELESLKKLAKDLLGLTAAQIAVSLGEGSLVEVEHEA